MILHAVRWKEQENSGFTRTEFLSLDEAVTKAKKLIEEGKLEVNVRLVDPKTDKFVGDVVYNEDNEKQ